MTSRRDFAAAAGGFGIGAALASVARLGQAAPAALDRGSPEDAGAPVAPLRGWTDVKQAGAKGDGRTDDTAVLQRVLDEKSGGVVYFPPGAYLISRTLRYASPVSLVGAGPRTSYLVSAITDGSPALELGDPSYADRLRGLRFADFTLRGAGAGALRSGGLRVHALYDSLVQNVRIETLGWGLDCDRAISVQFDDLVVTGMSDEGGQPGEGVYLYGQSNGCLFNGLRSTDHAGAALRLGDGQNLTLTSPVIESTRSAGVVVGQERGGRFVECRGVVVINPYFERNRPFDMQFLRGTPPTIIGGYWGPSDPGYVAPISSNVPLTAIGCAFPPAPGGALRVGRENAAALFLGCSFGGDVATFTRPAFRRSARLRVLGADADHTVGG